MPDNGVAIIILAAGLGKRMKSATPKVLHKIAGKPIIEMTVETVQQAQPTQIIVVTSPKSEKEFKRLLGTKCDFAIQKNPLGTADATSIGLTKVRYGIHTVGIMYGDDTAFYTPETIMDVYNSHLEKNPKITFVTIKKNNPEGLGRIIREDGQLKAIVEEKDATDEQRKIKEVNDGLYFFDKSYLEQNLKKIKPSKATGELYLTDLIQSALENDQQIETYELPDTGQWHGINTPQELLEANKKLIRNIHVMGIAGAGAAAVAGIAQGYGFNVTGCDLRTKSQYSENLNINVEKGHEIDHLKNIDLLIISPAVLKYDPQNLEIQEAKKIGIPVETWQEFQGEVLQQGKFTIAVSGAYGKSTTTAMISQILMDANLDPTCEVGASVINWDSNFKVGKSKYYVCEADEYNNNFLFYSPDIAVILNIDWDHPDFFKKEKDVENSFKEFIGKIKKNGILILPENPNVHKLIKYVRKDVNIITVDDFGKVYLSIIGEFRKENADAALTVAKYLGIDEAVAKQSLVNFKGAKRRLEYKGKIKNVEVYDDYAVQPYTVQTTADALKHKFPNKKVTLVLEPHTFTRIETFFGEFAKSLKNTIVDEILITDVYAARERGDVQELPEKLEKEIGTKAKYTGSLEKTANYIKDHIDSFEIILSMGAGNIYKLYDLLK